MCVFKVWAGWHFHAFVYLSLVSSCDTCAFSKTLNPDAWASVWTCSHTLTVCSCLGWSTGLCFSSVLTDLNDVSNTKTLSYISFTAQFQSAERYTGIRAQLNRAMVLFELRHSNILCMDFFQFVFATESGFLLFVLVRVTMTCLSTGRTFII